MDIPPDKKIVCITGSVWTGSNSAPRYLLVKDGFVRPAWFTTRIGITDAFYEKISPSAYRLALYNDEVLVYMKYGADYVGIMKSSFLAALETSQIGVLVVGPQKIAAQLGQLIHSSTIFALKDAHMQLSRHLSEIKRTGQLHRIDVDVTQAGAWREVHENIRQILKV